MPAAFLPRGAITGIGSLPYADAEQAAAWVLGNLPELPFWPQLPSRPGGRGMVAQFLGGFPGCVSLGAAPVIDTDCTVWREGCRQLARDFAARRLDSYGFAPADAPGWFALCAALARAPSRPAWVKGQVTGPATLATVCVNRNRVPLFVAADAFEAAVQWALLKGCRQIRELTALGVRPLLFLDEPGLATVLAGHSRTVEERSLAGIRRILTAWREAGAATGLHVCARIRWRALFDLGADVLSFDATRYLPDFLEEGERLATHLGAGGYVAWGVAPTAAGPAPVDPDAAHALVERALAALARHGVPRERALAHALFTPACGTAGLSNAQSEATFSCLRTVARLYDAGPAERAGAAPAVPAALGEAGATGDPASAAGAAAPAAVAIDVSAAGTWEEWYRTGADGWDKGTVSPPLARLVAEGVLRPPGRVLVLGAGRGHDALHLARAGFDVTAVDFADTACREARARAAAAGLPLAVLQQDLFTLAPQHRDGFDAVVEHTCYCAIDPRRRAEYAAVVSALVRPRGVFCGLFYRPAAPGGPPFPADLDEVRRLFAPAFELSRLDVPPDSFPARQGQEVLFVFLRKIPTGS
ncbi:MAG: methyltransferase domain-containing protein [Planctomycetes bacterium]|nr:methyltransferase domain-containing protein [Planctomycetota bacterium]